METAERFLQFNKRFAGREWKATLNNPSGETAADIFYSFNEEGRLAHLSIVDRKTNENIIRR